MNSMKVQKILTAIISVAIVAVLTFGIVSIVNTQSKSKEKAQENRVDLNAKNDVKEPTKISYENHEAKNEEKETTVEKEQPTVVVEQQAEAETKQQETEKVTENVQVNNKAESKYNFTENDILTWPVEGEIVLNYSMDRTIWFPTLKQYKCNPGIVIGAKEGTKVVASASGVVESVSQSEEYGTVIVVNIGGGYKTIYGQMNNSKNLKKGNAVIAGEEIGTVNKTSRYYISEGDNLFFKLTKDDKAINPIEYLE